MNLQAKLTDRQFQILELMATGLQQKEVANLLDISVKTVDNHIQVIKQKIGINNDRELTVFYFCRRFSIPYALIAIKRHLSALLLVCIFSIQIIHGDSFQARRVRSLRSSRRYECLTDNLQTYE